MSYPSCKDLVNLDATCDAIKKVGGVTARVWIGKKRDFIDESGHVYFKLDDPDNTFGINVWYLFYDGTDQDKLAYFEGVQLKNTGNFEVTQGDNVNAFTHNVNLVLFHYTQEQLTKLQTLMLDEDMVCIILTESGIFKVYGLDYDSNNVLLTKLGLKAIAGTGADIVDFQGEVGVNIQLQATNMLQAPFILNGTYETLESNDYTSVVDITNSLNTLSSGNG